MAALCVQPCMATTSGALAGMLPGTYVYIASAPGFDPNPEMVVIAPAVVAVVFSESGDDDVDADDPHPASDAVVTSSASEKSLAVAFGMRALQQVAVHSQRLQIEPKTSYFMNDCDRAVAPKIAIPCDAGVAF
jgi:hypothetical protein